MHERIAGWFALVPQSEHGAMAGIPVRYSAKNRSHDDGDVTVSATWEGGPTAAIVAQMLTHCNGFWEPATASVDWAAPDQVDVHLFGVKLSPHSRFPEYRAMRDGVPAIDVPADGGGPDSCLHQYQPSSPENARQPAGRQPRESLRRSGTGTLL